MVGKNLAKIITYLSILTIVLLVGYTEIIPALASPSSYTIKVTATTSDDPYSRRHWLNVNNNKMELGIVAGSASWEGTLQLSPGDVLQYWVDQPCSYATWNSKMYVNGNVVASGPTCEGGGPIVLSYTIPAPHPTPTPTPTPIPTPAQPSNYFTVSGLNINGQGNYIEVDAGTTISGSVSYTIWDSSCPGCIKQLVIGLNNDPKTCIFDSIPGAYPGKSGTASFSFTAPTSPGTYTVGWTEDAMYGCGDAKNNFPGKSKSTLGTVKVKEAQAPQKPDFIVNDISWTPTTIKEGDTVTFNVKFSNIGTGGSTTWFYNNYYIDGEYVDQDGAGTTAGDPSQIHSGDFSWKATSSGWHTVKMVTDATNLIAERNENNNVMEKSFYVNPAPPTTGNITVTTNLAGASFTLTGASTYSGSGTSWSKTNAPAGTYTITYGAVTGYNTPPSETKTLPEGGSITFSGTYPTPQPAQHPDFIVNDISWTPTTIKEGDTVTFNVKFSNIGTGGSTTWFYNNYYIDGQYVDQDGAGTTAGDPSQIHQGAFSWKATSSGWHTVKMVTDATNLIAEINENNNAMEKSFYVNPAPPTTGNITVTTNLAGASFTLTGASTYSGSGTSWSKTNAPAGTYTITYGAVTGYNTPPSETKTLSGGGSITFSGTYPTPSQQKYVLALYVYDSNTSDRLEGAKVYVDNSLKATIDRFGSPDPGIYLLPATYSIRISKDGCTDQSFSVTIPVQGTKYVAMNCNVATSPPSASIKSASVDKSSYNSGETVKVSVTIKNTGTVDLSGLKINVDIADPNGNNVKATTLKSGESLSAGQTYSTGYISYYNIPSNPISGTYKVTVGLWNSESSKNYDIKYQITSFYVEQKSESTFRTISEMLEEWIKNPTDKNPIVNQKVKTSGVVFYSTNPEVKLGKKPGEFAETFIKEDLIKLGWKLLIDVLFKPVDLEFIGGDTYKDKYFYDKYKIVPYIPAYVDGGLKIDEGLPIEIEGTLLYETRATPSGFPLKGLFLRVDKVVYTQDNYISTTSILEGQIESGKDVTTSGMVKKVNDDSNSMHLLNAHAYEGSVRKIYVSYPLGLRQPVEKSLVKIQGTLKGPEINNVNGVNVYTYFIEAKNIEILFGKYSEESPDVTPIVQPFTSTPTPPPQSTPTRTSITPTITVTTPSRNQKPDIENLKILAPPSIKKDGSDKIQVSYKLSEGFNPFKSENSLFIAGIFKMTIKNKVAIKEKWGLFDLLTRDVGKPVDFTRTIERSGDDVIVKNEDGTSKTVTFNELDNYLRSYDYQISVKGSDFKSGFWPFEFWVGVHKNVYAEVNTEWLITSTTNFGLSKSGSVSAKSEYVAVEITK